jgi:predicted PhzF superfamily epimerase YddE/YHI9
VLWESGRLEPGKQARFHTRSGLLTAQRSVQGMTMDFPSRSAEQSNDFDGLPDLLGVQANFVGKNGMDCLVDCGSERAVRSIRPDFARLAAFPVRGIIVTARSDDPAYDFVSRFFAPRAGVNEDPVTGSAHCCLGPYWAERLEKRDLIGYQVSARGGLVRIGVRGVRVLLGGQAVTVMRGELCA